ncbi:hypothetical protein ACFL6D_04740 [Spirochaetota bacterium]
MDSNSIRSFVVLLILSFFIGCTPRYRSDDSYDSFIGSLEVKVPCTVTGKMGEKDQFIRIISKKEEVFDLTFSIDDTIPVMLICYSKKKEAVKKIERQADGGFFARSLSTERVHYIVLHITDPFFMNKKGIAYTFIMEGLEGSYETEPNDRFIYASRVELNSQVRGFFISSVTNGADEDWFRIELEDTNVYIVNIDLSEVEGIDSVIEVYDMNSFLLKSIDGGGVSEAEYFNYFKFTGPSIIYFRLFDKIKGDEQKKPYYFLTEVLPYDYSFEIEPNDILSHASGLAGVELKGYLFPQGDMDYYKIKRKREEKILSISCSGLEGKDIILSFLDRTGDVIIEADAGGIGEAEFIPNIFTYRGPYYVLIDGKDRNRINRKDHYILAKREYSYEKGMEKEVNDTPQSAQTVSLDEVYSGYIFPDTDTDFFKFNSFFKSTLRLEVSPVNGVVTKAAIYNQEYSLIKHFSATNAGEKIGFDIQVDTGTYYISIFSANTQGNPKEYYFFSLIPKKSGD